MITDEPILKYNVKATIEIDIRAEKRWVHLPDITAKDTQRAEAFLCTLNLWEANNG